MHRIIRDSFSLYSYRVQILLQLDKFRRLEFCDTFLRLGNSDETVLSRIQFSDEANIYLSGHINKHNMLFWAKDPPHGSR